MEEPFAYASANLDRFIRELQEYLQIPSVSTLPENQHEVRRAAEWAAEAMRRIGLEGIRLLDTEGGNPPKSNCSWKLK